MFDGEGRAIATRPLAPPRTGVDLLPLARTDAGGILAVYGAMRLFLYEGIVRDSIPLLRLTESGTVVDTLGVWEGKEYNYQSLAGGGSTRIPVGFGRDVVHAGADSFAVVGSTDSLDLTVFGGTGKALLRIRGGRNTPVPADRIRQWREEQEASLASAPPDVRKLVLDTPVHETYPALAGVAISDLGEVWIGEYTAPSASERVWIVLGRNGELLGKLTLPVESTIVDAAGGKVALLERDSLDREFVSVWTIVSRS